MIVVLYCLFYGAIMDNFKRFFSSLKIYFHVIDTQWRFSVLRWICFNVTLRFAIDSHRTHQPFRTLSDLLDCGHVRAYMPYFSSIGSMCCRFNLIL